MSKTEKREGVTEPEQGRPLERPQVFISHDSRDAELAEAFGQLLKGVSSGMVKTFRSSDKKGTEGIAFGAEWYRWLMDALDSTSDIVCLFTERSLGRPWILYEAGVAKGKLGTAVVGLALGVPIARVNEGPFSQFQNMSDTEDELSKLILQLSKKVPGLEPQSDVMKTQIAAFKKTAGEILKKLGSPGGPKEKEATAEENLTARFLEEMKSLPARVAERLAEADEPFRRRRARRLHPMMFEEMAHMAGNSGDPVGILMAASLVRDDAPWLYELAMEVYRAVKSGDPTAVEAEAVRLDRFSETMMRGPVMEEMGFVDRGNAMFLHEFPRMLRHMLVRTMEARNRSVPRRHLPPSSADRT